MAVSTIYTHFHFKANHLRDLQNTAEDKPIRVKRDVSIEHHDLKLRQSRSGPER